jgi:hypothetical protein
MIQVWDEAGFRNTNDCEKFKELFKKTRGAQMKIFLSETKMEKELETVKREVVDGLPRLRALHENDIMWATTRGFTRGYAFAKKELEKR